VIGCRTRRFRGKEKKEKTQLYILQEGFCRARKGARASFMFLSKKKKGGAVIGRQKSRDNGNIALRVEASGEKKRTSFFFDIMS